MKRTIYVDCPCCETRLEVDAEDGKVVAQWKKGPKDPGKDTLSEGLKKIQDDKERRKSLLEATQQDLAQKKRKAEEAFRQKLDQAKKEGPEKPHSPFDLD